MDWETCEPVFVNLVCGIRPGISSTKTFEDLSKAYAG